MKYGLIVVGLGWLAFAAYLWLLHSVSGETSLWIGGGLFFIAITVALYMIGLSISRSK